MREEKARTKIKFGASLGPAMWNVIIVTRRVILRRIGISGKERKAKARNRTRTRKRTKRNPVSR